MGTIKKTEEFERFAFEFWNPVNQTLSKTEKKCPKFNTCELNPFQLNRDTKK